jgi:hypothetical protein
LKVRPPGADVVLKSSSQESFCRASAGESRKTPPHTRSASQSKNDEELRFESIVLSADAIVTDDTRAGTQAFFSLGGNKFPRATSDGTRVYRKLAVRVNLVG